MSLLEAKAPSYLRQDITLAALGIYTFNVNVDFFAVISASGATVVSINEGPESTLEAGITYKMPPGRKIRSIRIRETAGAVASATLGLGDGEIYDSRSNVSGNVSVQNAASPNDELQVKTKAGTTLAGALAAADPGLVALLAGQVAALQASQSLRARLMDLTGCTYFENLASPTTEVTHVASGSNTAGIILQIANVHLGQYNHYGYIGINDGATKVILGQPGSGTGAASGALAVLPAPLLIPSGVALVSRCDATTVFASGWYKVL